MPVRVHEADAALARGEVPNPAKGLGPSRIAPLLRFFWYAGRRGGLRTKPLVEVATFGDGATLDVPGAPRVVLVPGHTPGSAALHIPALDALFVGDAFATLAVTTGATGPRVAPFTADERTALASLDRLARPRGRPRPARSRRGVAGRPRQGDPAGTSERGGDADLTDSSFSPRSSPRA